MPKIVFVTRDQQALDFAQNLSKFLGLIQEGFVLNEMQFYDLLTLIGTAGFLEKHLRYNEDAVIFMRAPR